MKYNTQNKDYEIEFSHVGKFNGKSTPVFALKVSRPFVIEERFDINRLSSERGVDGIRFSGFTKIAKKVGSNGKSILFSLTSEAIDYVRNTSEEIITEIRENSQQQTVKKWYWAIGGDTHSLHIAADINTEFRPDIRAICGKMENTRARGNIQEMLMEKSTSSDRSTALYTPSGWFEISNEDMMIIYNMIEAEEDEMGKMEKAKREKKEAERQAIIKKAVDTGEKQVIFRTVDECNDVNEECNIDEIVEYAMPDGTTETKRYHTW